MVRKSISIGPGTWEALSSLGKFGQSFDDVIQILLKEHEVLNKLLDEHKDLVKKEQEYDVLLHHFRAPPILGKDSLDEISLPGLQFPKNVKGLLQYAQDMNNKEFPLIINLIVKFLRIPEGKVYNNASMLEEDISKVFNMVPDIVAYKKQQGIKEMIYLRINTRGKAVEGKEKGKEVTV